jgi:hypothetical protein
MKVLEDRHIDIQIEVFDNIIKALKKVIEWQYNYEGPTYDYKFEEQEIKGWEYYISAGDDRPNIHIEKKEVK